jgi:4-alpha-glucanotransferase
MSMPASRLPSIMPTFQRRTSGLLMHITSLPGPHGSGDLSTSAYRFVDFLSAAGQSWWQTLPVGPPEAAPGNSPYSSYSSLAGSPWLISLEDLREEGWLTRSEIQPDPEFAAERVHFPQVYAYREQRLRRAWTRFQATRRYRHGEFRTFCTQHRDWLDTFALFCTLKKLCAGVPWNEWPQDLRCRHPAALAEIQRAHQDEFDYHRWVQFQFHRQWTALRRYAHQHHVALLGDLPICVSLDSADVWAHPELFKLDAYSRPTRLSGYPPDAFCKQGQLWGHPLYDWPAHQRTGFHWWTARFVGVYRLFDAVRLDHFLGFTRLWSIPASTRNARHGRWVRTPGRELLRAVHQALGVLSINLSKARRAYDSTLAKARRRGNAALPDSSAHGTPLPDSIVHGAPTSWSGLPLIAEDLGHVTPADIVLRDEFGIPAMRILHWGIGSGDPLHRPHNFSPHTVAYTGTHDTDTVVGWFNNLKPAARKAVLEYTGSDGRDIHFDLIRLALNSIAHTVIVPVQDLLGLGRGARMNRPGTPTGNWQWRVAPGQLSPPLARRLRRLTELAERRTVG